MLLELLELERQHCKSLVDVIVQLSPDSHPLLFLRFNQLPAHAGKRLFHLLATGDVLGKDENSSHGAFRGLPRANFPACPMGAVLPIPAVFIGSQGFSRKSAAMGFLTLLRHISKKLIVRTP